MTAGCPTTSAQPSTSGAREGRAASAVTARLRRAGEEAGHGHRREPELADDVRGRQHAVASDVVGACGRARSGDAQQQRLTDVVLVDECTGSRGTGTGRRTGRRADSLLGEPASERGDRRGEDEAACAHLRSGADQVLYTAVDVGRPCRRPSRRPRDQEGEVHDHIRTPQGLR